MQSELKLKSPDALHARLMAFAEEAGPEQPHPSGRPATARTQLQAEVTVRTMGLFLANMSHEIRTPLTSVIGMTSLLLDTPMSQDQRDYANTIRASGQALLQIVNDLLDYSKADVGKLEIEQQAFDLRRCVEDSLDLVALQAHEKGLNLAYLVEDDTPEALVGDATRIRQILVNLLSNAVKFTHQGEVLISVNHEPLDGNTYRIHFAVLDSGIGIAAEHIPRLFQSFSQVDASTTRRYGGTGLGLAISKRLAELMGGTVTVQSTPGKGSEFHVTMLAKAACLAEPAPYLQREVPALAGKRLLIVDDSLTDRRILTRLALRWGMVPSTLPSTLEAVDRMRHGERYDAAVLDMGMPGNGGLGLAAEIRSRFSAAELPIVMLTLLGRHQTLEDTNSVPTVAYVTKPIKARQLFAKLVSMLQESPSTLRSQALVRPRAATPRPLRVLVAEDNAVNQRLVLLMLQRQGYSADVAANGLEVIEAVERQPYDVVLMDIQMPEVDGLQATRWIVQRRGSNGMPRIIAMTANAMPGDREAYLAAGIDGYLAKPIDSDDLNAMLVGLSTTALPASATTVGLDQEEVLDTSRLEHLRSMQGDSQPGLVRGLIDMFVADSPGHVSALTHALDAADAPALGRLAHRFLSVTQNIGALRLSRLCIEIECLCRQGQLEFTPPLVGALGQECERTRSALLASRPHYC